MANIILALEKSKTLSAEYQDVFKGISSAVDQLRTLGPSMANAFSHIEREKELWRSAAMSAVDQVRENYYLINDHISSFKTTAQLIKEDFEKIKSLVEPTRQWIVDTRSSILEIHEAALGWEAGIAVALNRFKEANILINNEPLALRLLSPSCEFASFVEFTDRKLYKSVENSSMERALKASLSLSESQFLDISDILSSVVSPDIDIIAPSPIRPLRVPRTQQRELIRAPKISDVEDEELLISLSPTAEIARIARDMIRMVTGCNEQFSAEGKQEMFKPTTRFVEASVEILWLVASDKHSFADFIDSLYFVFYEGAGKDKLRYLQEHGGVLNSDECNFIWCLKTLRNKWLRHDPDHGSASDQKRAKESLREHLLLLGMKRLPQSAQEFRTLQRKLLEEGKAFMQRIFDRLPVE